MSGGSGFIVEWRTPLGVVVDRERRWSESEAVRYAREYAPWFPALAPWLRGPLGGERRLAGPLRPWGGAPLPVPGTPQRRAA